MKSHSTIIFSVISPSYHENYFLPPSKIPEFFTYCFSIQDTGSDLAGMISKPRLFFRAILTMDGRDQFPVDMVEQMLKFTPSPEERALLDEHADEIDHLARADRFLFELSKYEEFNF